MNKTMIIGNLGKEPDFRQTQSGTAVATFSVATTERWKNAEGEKQEHTEWHRIVAWRRLAEICRDYLDKGSKVYICGKLRTRSWEDQDGITHYTREIIAEELEMLGGSGQGAGGIGDSASEEEPPMPDDIPF